MAEKKNNVVVAGGGVFGTAIAEPSSTPWKAMW